MPTHQSQDAFLKALQQQAQKQSQLERTQLLPHTIAPLSSFVANHTWQSLLFLSFLSSWIVLLIWFEFLFKFMQNIV